MRMKFADISARAEDSAPPFPASATRDPIDLRKLSAQLRGEATA